MFRTIATLFSQKLRDERGVASIELAIVSPMLLVMAVATVDFGLAVHASMQVHNSAAAGAHRAILKGFDETAITQAIENASSAVQVDAEPKPNQFCGCVEGTAIAPTSCTAKCIDGNKAGKYVSISAKGTYKTMIPYPLIPKQFVFEAQSSVRIP